MYCNIITDRHKFARFQSNEHTAPVAVRLKLLSIPRMDSVLHVEPQHPPVVPDFHDLSQTGPCTTCLYSLLYCLLHASCVLLYFRGVSTFEDCVGSIRTIYQLRVETCTTQHLFFSQYRPRHSSTVQYTSNTTINTVDQYVYTTVQQYNTMILIV